LLVQGEADTLFDLQESVATYRGLQAQGTPVKMIWQSWGHSHSAPAPGELDLSGADPTGTYEGARFAAWFDHYLADAAVDTGPGFAWFRDWVGYGGIATPAYGTSASYPVGTGQRLYLSGSTDLVTAKRDVRPGSSTYANLAGPVPTSYSETSAAQDSVPDETTPPTDAPGTYAAWTTAPLTGAVDTVGVPTLDLRLSSTVAQTTQALGPAGQLLLFAKVYDVAPDGSVQLVHRLVSPTRVADVTAPLHLELPGIVHRFAAGHRLRVVVAATDAAYRNNATVTPVTVLTDPAAPGVLTLPVVGRGVRTG
jgi:predicted acyl esterase